LSETAEKVVIDFKNELKDLDKHCNEDEVKEQIWFI
jgi:hypothetical protein